MRFHTYLFHNMNNSLYQNWLIRNKCTNTPVQLKKNHVTRFFANIASFLFTLHSLSYM